jgi:hypothetical protein
MAPVISQQGLDNIGMYIGPAASSCKRPPAETVTEVPLTVRRRLGSGGVVVEAVAKAVALWCCRFPMRDQARASRWLDAVNMIGDAADDGGGVNAASSR